MRWTIFAAVSAALIATGAQADEDDDDDAGFGQAGVLSKQNRGEIPEIILSAGTPLLEEGTEIRLKSGTYYELEITADGSQELALAGSGFFRAIWVDEVVIEGIETRPLGIDSFEFDEAGTMEVSFLAIKPGMYKFGVPGSDLQSITIIIE